MERLLARLERRLGGYAVPNLTAVVVAGMAAVFLAGMMRESILDRLTLDFDAVKHGEVWRLVTYLFIPRSMSPLWILFSLSFVWYIGSTLESHWGSFRFNLFYLFGCAGTTLAAWLTGEPQTNLWINCSLMLAFGTLFPDEVFNLFLILPVKAKWYAVFDALFLAYSVLTGDAGAQAGILAATSGYFIFCGPALVALLRGRRLAVRQAARRASAAPIEPAVSGKRVCAMCGAREEDGVDIRVCSCAKCGGPRNLCLTHARSH
jgi:membrane associated rhomboid family serine protease